MARTGGEIWPEETGRGFGGADSDGGGGISGSRVDGCVLGRGAGFIAYGRSGHENLFAERPRASGWRSVSQRRFSRVVAADCGKNSGGDEASQWDDDRG